MRIRTMIDVIIVKLPEKNWETITHFYYMVCQPKHCDAVCTRKLDQSLKLYIQNPHLLTYTLLHGHIVRVLFLCIVIHLQVLDVNQLPMLVLSLQSFPNEQSSMHVLALLCKIISIKCTNSIVPTKEQLSDYVVHALGKKFLKTSSRDQPVKVQRQGRNESMQEDQTIMEQLRKKILSQEDYLYLLYMQQMQDNLLAFHSAIILESGSLFACFHFYCTLFLYFFQLHPLCLK